MAQRHTFLLFCIILMAISVLPIQSKALTPIRVYVHDSVYFSGPVYYYSCEVNPTDSFFAQPQKVGQYIQEGGPIFIADTGAYYTYTVLVLPPAHYVLEFPDHRLNSIDIWYATSSIGEWTHLQAGNWRSANADFLFNKNTVTSLPEADTIFLKFKIQSAVGHALFCNIKEYTDWIEYATHEATLLGIFYGFVFIMFLLNTALFLYTRRVVHIWYAVYMIAFSLFSATQDGWYQLYVYPIVSVSNDYLYALLSLVALTAQSIYYMQFMQVKDRTPFLYKAHSSLIVLRVLFFLFSWFFFPEGLTLIVFDTFLLLPACVSSVYLWVKGVEEVRLIAIGYIVFFMGFLIHSLESIHWIPNSMFTVYASQLGVIVEMFCQILAFGDQWRIERNARLAAKQEVIVSLQANQELQQQLIQELQEKEWISQRVNRELNDKVAERTIEIQKINSALDKIVYDKDRLILSERWNRIFHVITESTFDQLFRKEEECYLFLDRLKNEESQYRCNSCDSSDTAIDWSQHARICNTCGHKALIKQHTIFQGSKIPLDKAFKILFFTVHQSPYSYEQLSIKLDLRKATVHAFKQKITDHITTLGKSYTLKELFILSSIK